MTIRGRLWVKFLYRSVFGRKLFFLFLGPIFDFGGIFQVLNINFEFRFSKRFGPCVRPRCPSHRAWKSDL